MLTPRQLFGGNEQRTDAQRRNDAFNTHVCLPCIVQEYDSSKRTVDVQPAIRERYVGEDGKIQYVNYPLLVNVPVCFPSAGGYHIHFPIKRGDECIVIFSDLSYDNFWLHGNVQNPVEQRRHDLSDGLAFFGFVNQDKIDREEYGENEVGRNCLCLYNSETGSGISIGSTRITLHYYIKDKDTGELIRTSTSWGV